MGHGSDRPDPPPGLGQSPAEGVIVRVIPDVAAISRSFDYLVPPQWAGLAQVGSLVRIDLAGRRVGGWVAATGVEPPEGVVLRPVSRVRGMGPEAGVVDLARWGAWRWAGRPASLLATASAESAVTTLPPPRLRPPVPPPSTPIPLAALDALGLGAPTVVRLGPAADLTPVIAALAQRGPALVVVPSHARAAVLADRLRRAAGDVALLPGQWAQARAGAAVVVGARAAVWGPCPGIASVVVVDGHDESLVQQQAPTWSAPVVAAERARRASVPCVVLSACPTLELLAGATLLPCDPTVERKGWAPLEIIDRRADDPRLGLWSQRVVSTVRRGGRVLAVLNRAGRARLLACSSCGSIARCERCGGPLTEDDGGGLHCGRCGLDRPVVCAECDSMALRRLRLGVGRAREQLEALVGGDVGEVTGATADIPDTPVLIGTEAILHRVERADVVVFLDFDQHLLAPRYRAGEQALALLARASRLVGGRRRGGGRVLAQTRLPDHAVLRAAANGDAGILTEAETTARIELRLPPSTAVAALSGPGADVYAGRLRSHMAETVELLGGGPGRWIVRAPSTDILCDLLDAVERPPGRLRVDVDPIDL